MTEENPYASPLTEPITAAESTEEANYPIASQGKRFLNYFIDNVVIQLLVLVTGFAFGMIYVALNEGQVYEDDPMLDLLGFAVGILTALGYYLFMEMACQRTIGKFLTGTRVVTADGEAPTKGQIIGRSFARFVPFEAFSFLVGNKPIGWHDSWSGTRVVSTR